MKSRFLIRIGSENVDLVDAAEGALDFWLGTLSHKELKNCVKRLLKTIREVPE